MGFGVCSEYASLSSVMLYRPGCEVDNILHPQAVQHLHPIDHSKLMKEFDAITDCFSGLAIHVNLIDPTALNADRDYLYNMMYCRDLCFLTPQGAILANMANATRTMEPLYVARCLESLGIPLLHTVSGSGRFEGADAIWFRSDLVLVGVGNRTNFEGYQQVKDLLKRQGVECISLPSSQMTTQHLLGSMQIVDSNLALVRHEIISAEIIKFLEDHGMTVVRIPENREVTDRQAMNIVTVAPRKIVMTSDCPETKSMYQEAGLTIAAELDLTQLINGAGGLACATAILERR